MTTLSMISVTCPRGKGGENSIFKLRYESFATSTVFRGFCKSSDRVWFRNLEGCSPRNRHKFFVAAMTNKGNKPEYFSYEKPLFQMDKKIAKLNEAISANGLRDFYDPVRLLELKQAKATKYFYDHLTQMQRMAIARHPLRPTVLDHIENITYRGELHEDQAGYGNDPAIVGGLGSIEGECYMFIGHQRIRNSEENFGHNFAVPTPHGYEKALRRMKFAEHCGIPIVTFVDTIGSFADLKSEQLGQDEAIAHNLSTIFGLKVPIITIVTGEGGSGGALEIACANKLLMLENSAFYVASQDAWDAILQKYSSAGLEAPEKLYVTALEHCRLRIAGCLIPESENGAHADPDKAYSAIKNAIIKAMEEVRGLGGEELVRHRMLKFQAIGEIGYDGKEEKHEMEPSDAKASKTGEIESQLEELTMKFLEAEGTFDPIILPGDRCYVDIPSGFPIE